MALSSHALGDLIDLGDLIAQHSTLCRDSVPHLLRECGQRTRKDQMERHTIRSCSMLCCEDETFRATSVLYVEHPSPIDGSTEVGHSNRRSVNHLESKTLH